MSAERERDARERITVLSRDIRKAAIFLLDATDGTHEGAMEILEQLTAILHEPPPFAFPSGRAGLQSGTSDGVGGAYGDCRRAKCQSRGRITIISDNLDANPLQTARHKQDSNPTYTF